MRKKARELALQILFQMEFAPQISPETFMQVFEREFNQDSLDFARSLIDGVNEFRDKIDAEIQAASKHWKLSRMTLIDKNIIRIATFEMKFAANPLKENIAINEAVELAKTYGTVESSSFVNGVLDQIFKKI